VQLVALGQESTVNSQPGQKSQPKDYGLGVGAPAAKQLGGVDILNDTQGVDFGPYLKEILVNIKNNWYHLIPEIAEMKKGKLAIEFAITKDGKVADMRLVASADDTILDRAAWGSITASNPFSPLPDEFKGAYLALRMRFYYNPERTDLRSSMGGNLGSIVNRPKTKSGIVVSITVPLPSDLDVPLGGSKAVTAIVTGTGTKEKSVDWSLSGFGCSGAMCGDVSKDSYRAPTEMPNPPYVTLTAISKADPSAKASVTLHIIESH